jgi:hypothetical protein
MNLDRAIKTGNFLQYAAQPVLLTAASVCFHAITKNRLPGSSVAAMVVVHSVTSHFFAAKATDRVVSNPIIIPLGSTVFITLITFASSKFRIEGKHGEGIACLAILGVVYALISFNVYSSAQHIIQKDIKEIKKSCEELSKDLRTRIELIRIENENRLKKEIETRLGEKLQIPEPMQRDIVAAWKIIDKTIERCSDEPNAQIKQPLSFYQPVKREKTFANLTLEAKIRVIKSLASQKITLFNGKVFAIEKYTHVIFKKISRRDFELLISHQLVCEQSHLTELVIPASKLVVIKDMTFVVQEKLNYNAAKQSRYYFKYADRLKKAVLQLYTYVLQTREADVEWRNMPVIGNVKDKSSPLRIALIDHEILSGDNPEWGIVGYERLQRTGLIGLLCEEQAREVALLSLQVLSKFGHEINAALKKRVAELEIYKQELERNRTFKAWALKRGRKSNETIPLFTNLPLLTRDQLAIIGDIWTYFNQAIAKQNPQYFLSRYDLRTIKLTCTPSWGTNFAEYRQLIEKSLSILKDTDNIFAYKTELNWTNFQHQLIATITA